MPELTEETQQNLRQWIPGYLRISNPVDSGGAPSGDWRGRQILEALLADPGIGVVVCPFVANAYHLSDAVVADVVEVAATAEKPVCVVWGSPTGTEPAYRDVLAEAPVVTFRTFRQCVTALKGYFDYHAARRRYLADDDERRALWSPPPGSRPAVDLPAGVTLSERQSKALLAAYGIPVTDDVLATSVAEAVAAAARLGRPAVLKISSPDIAHKSDLGLVVVGVAGEAAVRRVYAELLDRAEARAGAAQIEGVLVSGEEAGGVETVLGLTHDEVFGPVVMFGLGGVFTEILGDVAFRVPPVTQADARAMVDGLRGRALLDGVRGSPPVDLDAVVAAVTALGRLALDLADEVAELDVNPLLARADGVIALDALVRTRPGRSARAH